MENDNTFVRFDWAIKHMLRDKSNFEILEGFLTVLIGEQVKIKEILESESNQDGEQDKFNRVDIKAENSKGHLIIVEVQVSREYDFLKRILYGVSKAITEHIQLGDRYEKVKKVYSISILYCDYGEGDDYVYHYEGGFKGLHTGNDLMVRMKVDDVLGLHHPKEVFPEYYLLRVSEFDKIPDSPLDEWMDYLKTGKVKEDTRTPGLKRVREKLQVLKMPPADREAYFRHLDNIMVQNSVLDTARTEGWEEGRAEGRAEGRVEGRVETNIENARKMLELGLPVDTIIQVTSLTEEQLSALRSRVN